MTERRTLVAAVVLAALCGHLAWSSQAVRSTASVTFDETFYLNAGLRTVHDGWLDRRLVSEGVAPLPILLTYMPSLLFQPREDRPDAWQGQEGDRDLIDGPRSLNTWLIAMPLVVVGFVWLYRRHGLLVAACGAMVLAASPTITAHAALATTDLSIAFFGLLAMLALSSYVSQPSTGRLVVLALALAAALSAKYSGVFLLPVAALMLLRADPRDGRSGTRPSPGVFDRLRWAAGRYALLLVLVGPVWWGAHFFDVTGPLKSVSLAETPDDSRWVELLGRGPVAEWVMDRAHREWKRPAPVDGVLFRWLHNTDGHTAFLMGERSPTGWWYYFPSAFAFKSTPVELVLTLGLAALMIAALRRPVLAWRHADLDRQVMCMSAIAMLAIVLTAHVNIGHRHLIVFYPLLILAAFDRIGSRLAGRRGALAGVCLLLAGAQVASHAAIGPHALAYFNRASGGPENGWRLLVDSNLDWGQDLPALRDEIRRLGGRRVALQYFGTAVPAAYGVDADPVTALARSSDDYDLLAVSVTMLQGMYVGDGDSFGAFRDLEPDGRAGYSIHLYRLDTPERRLLFRQVAAEMAGRTDAWREYGPRLRRDAPVR